MQDSSQSIPAKNARTVVNGTPGESGTPASRTINTSGPKRGTVPMTQPPKRTRRQVLAAGLSLGVAGLAGCGQSGSDPPATATPTSSPTPTATATETPTAADSSTETPTPAGVEVETLLTIPGERVPENLAVDADGNLYFGVTAGEVRRIDADRTGATGMAFEETDRLGTLPGAIGVELGPDGRIYVAVATEDERSGVWSLPPDGAGDAAQLVGIDGFPNDILFDADRDRLLVTESRNGTVYAVGTDGSLRTWLSDDRLDTASFGVNGITRGRERTVYVTVTRAPNGTGRLLEVPVSRDGTAGGPTTLFEGAPLRGADGVTARDGDIYVAVNSQNTVQRVSPDGTTATVASGDDGLVFPSDVLFGVGEMADRLFVCNFATQNPERGAVLRARL